MNELNRERREIANYLRALASHSAADEELVQDTLGLYRGNNIEGYDTYGVKHLADLIDRPTTTVTVASGDDDSDLCIKCNSCCRGWHISKYDKSFTYCPECGAEVVE